VPAKFGSSIGNEYQVELTELSVSAIRSIAMMFPRAIVKSTLLGTGLSAGDRQRIGLDHSFRQCSAALKERGTRVARESGRPNATGLVPSGNRLLQTA
jgi:hypothetical protein